MIRILAIAVFTALPGFASATDAVPETPLAIWQAERATVFDAADITAEDFLWTARMVLVFADTPDDPRFRQQMAYLATRPEDLAERDVVVITDTSPVEKSALRTKFRPRGFMMVLVGKDGGVKLRKPFAWDLREISRSIDKMPSRQQEIRDRRAPVTQ